MTPEHLKLFEAKARQITNDTFDPPNEEDYMIILNAMLQGALLQVEILKEKAKKAQ